MASTLEYLIIEKRQFTEDNFAELYFLPEHKALAKVRSHIATKLNSNQTAQTEFLYTLQQVTLLTVNISLHYSFIRLSFKLKATTNYKHLLFIVSYVCSLVTGKLLHVRIEQLAITITMELSVLVGHIYFHDLYCIFTLGH